MDQAIFLVTARAGSGFLGFSFRDAESALACAHDLLRTYSLVYIRDQHGRTHLAENFESTLRQSEMGSGGAF